MRNSFPMNRGVWGFLRLWIDQVELVITTGQFSYQTAHFLDSLMCRVLMTAQYELDYDFW